MTHRAKKTRDKRQCSIKIMLLKNMQAGAKRGHSQIKLFVITLHTDALNEIIARRKTKRLFYQSKAGKTSSRRAYY